jgi:hypothetical protein
MLTLDMAAGAISNTSATKTAEAHAQATEAAILALMPASTSTSAGINQDVHTGRNVHVKAYEDYSARRLRV